jgi:hypothetical protein
VDLGGGWSATVTQPARDITEAVLAENQFNDPPPLGFRFVGVDVTLGYSGEEPSTALMMTLRAVADDNLVQSTQCGVIPGELDRFDDVFPGGSISGTLCFVVEQDALDSLVLYGTGELFSDDYVYLATR